MLNFIMFLFATVGMTSIIVDSSMFGWLRSRLCKFLTKKWGEKGTFIYQKIEQPLTCHQCMGTWCGFFCGYILMYQDLFHILVCGFAGSFVAVLADQIFGLILSHTTFELPGE